MRVRNFKRLADATIELADRVVFVGPNNSGKTSALQALSLWSFAVKRWNAKRSGRAPEKRPGVLISRREMLDIPLPSLDQLWTKKRLRISAGDKTPPSQNIVVQITVEGIDAGAAWECGFEFTFRDDESIYARPVRCADGTRMTVPEAAGTYSVAMLPPMSGLSANEVKLDRGAIDVAIGEGRTANVLRNLCRLVYESDADHGSWVALVRSVEMQFGVVVATPQYVQARGEIEMSYAENGVSLDISASGRGLQQTLLLLAYMHVHPRSVLVLDEPDAHLEIIRQREVYKLISDYAREHSSQLVAASHSEVVMDEALDKDVVIAFVGRPHRINDRGSQERKALVEIPGADYSLAEQKRRVLYLEGSTDLSILQAIATRLDHRAATSLRSPFVKYVTTQPSLAARHFFGLQKAETLLRGFALYDRLDSEPEPRSGLVQVTWRKREIENYVCTPAAIIGWVAAKAAENADGPLFSGTWIATARVAIFELENALRLTGRDPWGPDIKASDEFLDPLFVRIFALLDLPNLMRKTNYHELALYVPTEEIDREMIVVLDQLADALDPAGRETDA